MSVKNIRVLVTGASGSIGSELVKQLIVSLPNLELTLFDLKERKVRRKLAKYHDQAELVFGDIRKISELEKACHNQDIVLHLAALLPPMAYDNPEVAKETNAVGTKNLIDCLEQHSPKSFLLYTSSIAVYGDRLEDYWITVDDELRPAPGDVYAETKIAAENYIKESKLRWSIFRLTAIMGDHKPSRLMFHQPLATKMEIATIADTGRALVMAMNNLEQLEFGVFNLGGGEACRVQYDDFLHRSFQAMGLKEANFPAKAFAERNFHCGYYLDTERLEEILHFQSDSLDDYLRQEAAKIGPLTRLFLPLVRPLVRKWLLTLSEPYKAWKANDPDEKAKFY